MRVATNSEIWTEIFYPLRDAYYRSNDDDKHVTSNMLKEWFESLGFKIHCNEIGRWSYVDLPSNETIVELLLKLG